MNVFPETIIQKRYTTNRRNIIMYVVSVIYLSFLALERVNFLQGQASFGLTLELIGCSIFLLSYFLCDVIPKRKIHLYNKLSDYAKIMLAFIATVLLSVFFSADFALSARRLVLLSVYILSGLFSVNYLIIKYPDKIMDMVVNGMVVLSIIYAICSFYDVLVWFNLGLASKMSALFPFFRSNIWSIGSTFVRARGASGDPNRAGIFMIVNSYFILKYIMITKKKLKGLLKRSVFSTPIVKNYAYGIILYRRFGRNGQTKNRLQFLKEYGFQLYLERHCHSKARQIARLLQKIEICPVESSVFFYSIDCMKALHNIYTVFGNCTADYDSIVHGSFREVFDLLDGENTKFAEEERKVIYALHNYLNRCRNISEVAKKYVCQLESIESMFKRPAESFFEADWT